MDFKQRMAILSKNKKIWKDHFGNISDNTGIYILTRQDENGFKYAYVGQAKHMLTRLAEHLNGYQHIDLSLKKYGLYSKSNPYGWLMTTFSCLESELDEREQYFIKAYANSGYQLRNKTAGGQGVGKTQIDDYRPAKGYYDGLKQGYENARKDVRKWFSRLYVNTIKDDKISSRYCENFLEFLGGTDNVRQADDTEAERKWQ
jgi:hypothetical protein